MFKQGTVQRRDHPLLVRDWKHPWREEFIELRRGPKVISTGRVDEFTSEGTIIWIHQSGGNGRVMIHRNDGIDIWRVDSQVCQNRCETGPRQLPSS